MSVDLSLGSLLSSAINSRTADIHTALPARVEAYDASTRKADIKPLVKRLDIDEQGNREAISLPVVTNVPVVFPGAGDYDISWPIAKGDFVLVIFAESSIDIWLSEGSEVDPKIDHRHNLSDAIAIPGIRPFSDKKQSSANGLSISADRVNLGSQDASDPVVRKSDLQAHIDYIKTHTHPSAMGPTSPPTSPPPAAKGSSKVFSE